MNARYQPERLRGGARHLRALQSPASYGLSCPPIRRDGHNRHQCFGGHQCVSVISHSLFRPIKHVLLSVLLVHYLDSVVFCKYLQNSWARRCVYRNSILRTCSPLSSSAARDKNSASRSKIKVTSVHYLYSVGRIIRPFGTVRHAPRQRLAIPFPVRLG